jgi:uncharacterized protein (DUF488 family)
LPEQVPKIGAPGYRARMLSIATIGYEGATIASLQEALRRARIDLLVDVRALASSRRPGFAKTRLAANAKEAGAEYLHLRALGTPAEGRAAARAGHHAEMHRIFREQLATPEAQEQLALVADLVRQGRRICLLCFEARAEHCHRSIVAAALAEMLPATIVDLDGGAEEAD